jgi:hypothetical protein
MSVGGTEKGLDQAPGDTRVDIENFVKSESIRNTFRTEGQWRRMVDIRDKTIPAYKTIP